MDFLLSKKLLLIVTGGVAAYKSPEIVRKLRSTGADVRVAMTSAAQEFVTELTFQAVSGQDVFTSLFVGETDSGMGHIELARWADAIVVAPATANIISSMANGLAGDLAQTILLATTKPIFMVPSMNVRMWENPIFQKNLSLLKQVGVEVIGPEEGEMACGEYGLGRMSEPHQIYAHIKGKK